MHISLKRRLCSKQHNFASLGCFIANDAARARVCRDAPTDLQLAALQALLQLAADDRAFVAAAYSQRSKYLVSFLGHINAEVRTAAARLLAIVTAQAPDETVCQTLAMLQGAFTAVAKGDGASTGPKKYEEQHGSLVAAGAILCCWCSLCRFVRTCGQFASGVYVVTKTGGKLAQ